MIADSTMIPIRPDMRPGREGQRRNKDAENGELADLDPDIEGEQRYQQVRPGKLQLLLEHVGKAEAMH